MSTHTPIRSILIRTKTPVPAQSSLVTRQSVKTFKLAILQKLSQAGRSTDECCCCRRDLTLSRSYYEPSGANVDANITTDPTHDRFQDHYIRDNFLDHQGQAYADKIEWAEDPKRARASRKKSLGKQIRGSKGHSSKRQKHHGEGHGKK